VIPDVRSGPARRRRLAGLRPADLHLVYPAMVMGTGSLSTGALLLRRRELSVVLFVVGLASFGIMVVLAGAKVARHPDRVRADLADPRTTFAPYTFVAALAVLATRAALDGHTLPPWAALVVGVAGAAGLAIPARRMLRSHAGRLDLVTGNWQLPSVAVEALALLAVVLGLVSRSEIAVGTSVALWLTGIPVYLVMVPRMVRRFGRLPFGPANLTPDYWTFMAVPSLTGLVAARLWTASASFSAASWLRWAFEPVAVGGLAVSGILAPIWIALQVWRLAADPSSRGYSPPWWGLVFPTAVVVAGAEVIGATFGIGWLHPAAEGGFWVVLAAWAVVGFGLARDLVRREGERA
jgi:tellurite resistance protein TehA-like permease